MAGPTVNTTRLLRAAAGGAEFANVYRVDMSDGSALASPVQLSVSAGNALTGFPPDFAHGGGGAGFVPDGSKVRVTALTTNNNVGGAQTPGLGVANVNENSFVKDTADTTNTSMKLDIYVTASTVFALIIECPL